MRRPLRGQDAVEGEQLDGAVWDTESSVPVGHQAKAPIAEDKGSLLWLKCRVRHSRGWGMVLEGSLSPEYQVNQLGNQQATGSP